MITKIYFRFELMPPKDAELNFRGGPWENFSLTSSFKADKGEFELSGCGKPNVSIVKVKSPFDRQENPSRFILTRLKNPDSNGNF